MIPLKLKRRHLRAPLNNECLIKVDQHILKVNALNISEGGALLSELPNLEDRATITAFFEVPRLPSFSLMTTNDLFNLDRDKNFAEVQGVVLELKRKVLPNSQSGVVSGGFEFVDLRRESQEKIKEYVSAFGANIVFTLSLFEQGVQKIEVKELIRKCVHALGYPDKMSLGKIRETLLHDYQSLESL
ncbi:MAG: hypothetical protein CME61_04865 [Halobacteriovoraceae bacterium]|nr:hypothetical protein [Halobacteriovoraceae bacterium]